MMTFGKMNTCTHPIMLVQKLSLNGKKLGNLVLHDQEVVSVDLVYVSFMWKIEYGFAAPGKALWGECLCLRLSCYVDPNLYDTYIFVVIETV